MTFEFDTVGPTAPASDVYRIVPPVGWVLREAIAPGHDLERRHDGSERIVPVIRVNQRTA